MSPVPSWKEGTREVLAPASCRGGSLTGAARTGLGEQELQGWQSRGENGMGAALGTSDADGALGAPDCNIPLLQGLWFKMSMQRRSGR